MKKFYTSILAAMIMAVPAFAQVITEENCDSIRLSKGFPWHYCDCELQIKKNRITELPFDVTITDTTWYKSSSSLFLDGCSAFLYSECDVTMVLVQKCENSEGNGLYKEVVVQSNQARDVEPSSIKELMDKYGVDGGVGVRVGILPSEVGKESRFIVTEYNQGPHSTCENPLPILLDMVFVSSHPDDVYVLTPDMIPEKNGLKLEWFQTDARLTLEIAQGDCNGEALVKKMMVSGDVYELPADLLEQARISGENLYIRVKHPSNTVGRVRLSEIKDTSAVDDVTVPSTDARLVLDNGIIYILRDGVRYTLMGSRL